MEIFSILDDALDAFCENLYDHGYEDEDCILMLGVEEYNKLRKAVLHMAGDDYEYVEQEMEGYSGICIVQVAAKSYLKLAYLRPDRLIRKN